MNNDFLYNQAVLYAAGLLTASERDVLEVFLEKDEVLRQFALDLSDTSVAIEKALYAERTTPLELRQRIMASITVASQEAVLEGCVVSCSAGLVQWVNSAFTEMCGFALEELHGKKLGPILQGDLTDRETVGRMREAIHQAVACRERLVNYHRNGEPYWVDIAISPVHDDDGNLLWFVAREQKVADLAIVS